MRVGTVFGNKIFLTDIMYKKLLNRFDSKKFIKKGNNFVNQDSCPLCKKYSCDNCPINEEKSGDDCLDLLRKIMTPNGGQVFCHYVNLSYSDQKGKKQIDKVHSFLIKNFKKWRPKQ